MGFKKKSKISTEIPTSSMPDIVFLLMIFFMVTTTFRQSSGLPIDLPIAKRIEKLEAKKNVTAVWANTQGEISIDDKMVKVGDIAQVMYQKRVENPRIIVSLKADKACNMGLISNIHEKLRDADALRLNYTAKFGD
ncbi:biopolymer transporter ExbD [bacterium]|nr:biopolymer transporter ExbD [bacterium]